IGQALPRLSIKAPTIMNLGTAITDRRPQRFRHFQHNGTNRLSKMHVLVGIDVSWVFARQVPESSELARYLFPDGARLIQGHHVIKKGPAVVPINPFTEIDMQAEAKR